MTKRVNFKAKPKVREKIKDIENWIKDGSTENAVPEAETTRFTMDLPVELHAKIKYKCAIKKVSMKEEIQNLLENHFK